MHARVVLFRKVSSVLEGLHCTYILVPDAHPSSLTIHSAFSTLHSSVSSSTFFVFTYGGSLYLQKNTVCDTSITVANWPSSQKCIYHLYASQR